jgi:NAD(P)-dependent dehydrogenase (short-subunit alcohol dehydrogenase family)
MHHLQDRTAIVTGGGTGIGRSTALALAHAGARVVIGGRRREPLGRVVDEVTAAGGTCLAIPADVAHEDEVERLVNAAVAAFGTVDILVSSAGIIGANLIHEHSVQLWDDMMAVHLRAAFLLARAVLPVMRAQRRGDIILVSSEAGLDYYVGYSAYGVAKHALNALGEFIQRENQDHGIRAMSVCPGMVATDATKDMPGLNLDKCLTPDDVADLVLWLVTWRHSVKIGRPVVLHTLENPWQ